MNNTRAADLARAYELARPHLTRVAYAVLGSYVEAEDVVSDCWLRMVAADDRDPINDVAAWATVTVARAALDALRSARMRREVYVGPWLPEPIVGVAPHSDALGSYAVGSDPLDRVTLDDSVSYALLVVLETLTPAERTAWVLHDLFGLPFSDVAEAVGRTPAAVRQLAARARDHVQAGTPRVAVGADELAQTVTRFLTAAIGGDLSALIGALDPNVVLTSDGGGEVSAALRPVVGADPVARFVAGIAAMIKPTEVARMITVNGMPGLGVFDGDDLTTLVALTMSDDRISRIDIIRAPSKLRRLR